ncbi:MAG: hypothetical protein ACTSRZ_04845 [Promethearchaeota archaeon]
MDSNNNEIDLTNRSSIIVNFVGFIFFILMNLNLLVNELGKGDPNALSLILVVIYFVIHIFFWLIQMIYHYILHKGGKSPIIQRIDRASMNFLISAMFTLILILYTMNKPVTDFNPLLLGIINSSFGSIPLGIIIVLVILWLLTFLSLVLLLVIKNLSRKLAPILGFIVGLIGIFTVIAIINLFPLESVVFFVLGSLFFISSGIVYVLKKPNIKPNIFGFHELFHSLLTIGAVFLHIVIIIGFNFN